MQQAAKPQMDVTTIRDLTDIFAKPQCYCLNESPNSPYQNLFIGDTRLALRSDADEQLMLHLEFNETVKIHSLKFLAASNSSGQDVSSAPKVLKLFVNKPNIGFSEAEDCESTQTIELTEEDVTGDGLEVKLRFVKFQRVTSLSIFVQENFGDEESTALGMLNINGTPVLGTNVSELKKC